MPPAAPATSKFIRVGAPLLILVTSGWYALTTVISGKIEVRAARDRALELTGPDSKRPRATHQLDLEAEAERLTASLALDKPYDIKPVPRPRGW